MYGKGRICIYLIIYARLLGKALKAHKMRAGLRIRNLRVSYRPIHGQTACCMITSLGSQVLQTIVDPNVSFRDNHAWLIVLYNSKTKPDP